MTKENTETLPQNVNAGKVSGATPHQFAKPVNFEGQEIKQILLDLEGLTGKDISRVKSAWAQAGNFSPVAASDLDFCAMVACKAAGQPYEFADALPAKDYVKLAQEVSNFLLS